MAVSATATLAVFDFSGRRVALIFDGAARAGKNEVAAALELPPGVYVTRLEAGGEAAAGRVVVTR